MERDKGLLCQPLPARLLLERGVAVQAQPPARVHTELRRQAREHVPLVQIHILVAQQAAVLVLQGIAIRHPPPTPPQERGQKESPPPAPPQGRGAERLSHKAYKTYKSYKTY